ncbi:MAG: stage VI sporulation protein D [Bacillota bacterium]
MSQEQQDLRFSVEESVWFQKGQEVSELISISLDPDISIHEHNQYISIRGALLLTGEYKIDKDADVQDQFEYANVRYVNEVNTREDGVSLINHRFPVDITIPRNRIQQLEEVYVSIESFDYELPEIKCLKLIADLSISGISNEQSQPETERPEEESFEALYRAPQSQPLAEENEISSQFQSNSAKPFSSFYQEDETACEDVDKLSTDNLSVEKKVRKEEKAVEEPLTPILGEKVREVEKAVEEPSTPILEGKVRKEEKAVEEHSTPILGEIVREEEKVVEELSTSILGGKVREEEKAGEEPSTPILEEINEVDSESQLVEEDEQDHQEDLYDPFVVEVRKQEQETVEPQEVQYSFYSKSEDLASNQNQAKKEEENEREEKNDPKDAHYLTSLFARDEDEDFSRVKMCIVQQGDTIERICERYDISIQQIQRVNDFHADQDVYEGQILYIPAYSTSK